MASDGRYYERRGSADREGRDRSQSQGEFSDGSEFGGGERGRDRAARTRLGAETPFARNASYRVKGRA